MQAKAIMGGAFTVTALLGLGGAARADDAFSPTLPVFAQAPPADPSPWRGLYIGSGISFTSGKHGKGGLGGEAYAGYDRRLENNWIIGVQGSVGYAPAAFGPSRLHGFDYALASAKVGYQLGSVTPFVTAGVGFAKADVATFGGYTGASDSINSLFSGKGNLQSVTSVGAGFDYQVNSKVSFELSVSATQASGGLWPPPIR